MKAAGVFVLICIAALSLTAKADGPCVRVEKQHFWSSHGISKLKTCYMYLIAIDSKDFSITSDRDESLEGFYARNNKKLEYLPINLGAKFPNLFCLYAAGCSIREVSKDNFKGLSKLEQLLLSANQIEKIDDDTFEHIPAVERIYLHNNKIKKLHGRAFSSLHKLMKVYLGSNFCINEIFENATRIAELPQVVTGKCGFFLEPAEIAKLEADLMAKSEELHVLKQEIAKLQIEKAKADLQTAHHNENKAQLKEICDARIELKLQENVNLTNDLQGKIAKLEADLMAQSETSSAKMVALG